MGLVPDADSHCSVRSLPSVGSPSSSHLGLDGLTGEKDLRLISQRVSKCWWRTHTPLSALVGSPPCLILFGFELRFTQPCLTSRSPEHPLLLRPQLLLAVLEHAVTQKRQTLLFMGEVSGKVCLILLILKQGLNGQRFGSDHSNIQRRASLRGCLNSIMSYHGRIIITGQGDGLVAKSTCSVSLVSRV